MWPLIREAHKVNNSEKYSVTLTRYFHIPHEETMWNFQSSRTQE